MVGFLYHGFKDVFVLPLILLEAVVLAASNTSSSRLTSPCEPLFCFSVKSDFILLLMNLAYATLAVGFTEDRFGLYSAKTDLFNVVGTTQVIDYFF